MSVSDTREMFEIMDKVKDLPLPSPSKNNWCLFFPRDSTIYLVLQLTQGIYDWKFWSQDNFNEKFYIVLEIDLWKIVKWNVLLTFLPAN